MNLRKIFATLLVTASLLIATNAHAEIQTYTGEGTYVMSESENLTVAKERAKSDAMRRAQEQAGVYIRSYSRTKDFQLVEDEIITIASTIAKLLGEPHFYPLETVDNLEGVLIRVTLNVQIDSEDVNRWLKKDDAEKSVLIAQNEEYRRANAEQERQIAELKRQLAESTTQQDKERITQEFADTDKIFLSSQKVSEAWKLYWRGDFNGAIKLHAEAIALNPQNANAYYGRAYAYDDLKNYRQAIDDCTLAIKFNPTYVDAYNNRGEAYRKSGNFTQAIADYDKAIELNPNYARGYNNRGIAYRNLGNYTQAFADYDKAIALKPDYALAYYNRAYAYITQKNYGRAVEDLDIYIRLAPDDADGYINRGFCYQQLGDAAKAQADFDKAKSLG